MKNYITIEGGTINVDFPDEYIEDELYKGKFIRDEDSIALEKVAKYFLNENLNFLCGSDTSVSIGGKTINKKDDPFIGVLKELKEIKNPEDYIVNMIGYLESENLLEKKFDLINQEYLYYLNNKGNEKNANIIKSYFDKILRDFVDNFIPFPSDYIDDKLEVHELFISKIISRREILNRPKIFTANYDLAFENACERIGVSYNNGFRGVHVRKFDPDTFFNETYIKQDSSEHNRRIGTYLNIYKLHGSISWQLSESLNDLYNVQEIQISDSFKKEDFKTESLMIYPIQTKKSYSLDLPYSEIFRNFAKCLTDSQNTLVIIGYSFLDEHINDLIRAGLYNPNITLIIYSYNLIDESASVFLQSLKKRSNSDYRIIIYEGYLLGDFNNVVRYLIPLNSQLSKKEIIIETLKEISKY